MIICSLLWLSMLSASGLARLLTFKIWMLLRAIAEGPVLALEVDTVTLLLECDALLAPADFDGGLKLDSL